MSSHPEDQNFILDEFFDFEAASLEGQPNSRGPGDHATRNVTSNASWMSTANTQSNFSDQNFAPLAIYGGSASTFNPNAPTFNPNILSLNPNAPSFNPDTSNFYNNFSPANSIHSSPNQLPCTNDGMNMLGGDGILGNVGLYQFSNTGSQLGILDGNVLSLSLATFPDGSFSLGTVGAYLNSASIGYSNTSTDLGSSDNDNNNNTAGSTEVATNPAISGPVVDNVPSNSIVDTASSALVAANAHLFGPAVNTALPKLAVNATSPRLAVSPDQSNVNVNRSPRPSEPINENVVSDPVNNASTPSSSNDTNPPDLRQSSNTSEVPDNQVWDFVNSTGSDFDDHASVQSISSESADSSRASTPDELDDPDNTLFNSIEDNVNSNRSIIPIDRQVAYPTRGSSTGSTAQNLQENHGRSRPGMTIAEIVADIIAERQNNPGSSSDAIHTSDDDGEDDYRQARSHVPSGQPVGQSFNLNHHPNPQAGGSGALKGLYGFCGFQIKTEDTPPPFDGLTRDEADQIGGRDSNVMLGAHMPQSVYYVQQEIRPTQNRQSAKSRCERCSSLPLSRIPSPGSPPRPMNNHPAQAGPSRARSAPGRQASVHPAQVHQAAGRQAQARNHQTPSYQAHAGSSRAYATPSRQAAVHHAQSPPTQADLFRTYATPGRQAPTHQAQIHQAQIQQNQTHQTQADPSRAYATPVRQAPVPQTLTHPTPAGPVQAHAAQSRYPAQSSAPTQSAHYAPAHYSPAQHAPAHYTPISRSAGPPAYAQPNPPAQVNRKRKSIDESDFNTLDVQQSCEEDFTTIDGPSRLYTPASSYPDSAYATATYQGSASSSSAHQAPASSKSKSTRRKRRATPEPPTYPTPADEERASVKYEPLYDYVGLPRPPNAPASIYNGYVGYFATSDEAKQYRKRVRHTPEEKSIKSTRDLQMVKNCGRGHWVRRLYESMIDVSCITDSESSIHRQRFVDSKVFDEKDIEAAAHKIFEEAVAVHERGWNYPMVYYKKVHRGKLEDQCLDSVEKRLALICRCLAESKAAVDDALRGGITLGLVCDNPMARGGTKQSNNTGNRRRGERLRQIRDATGGGQTAGAADQTADQAADAGDSAASQGPRMDKGKGRVVEEEEIESEEGDGEYEDDDEWHNAQEGGELYGDEVYGMERYGMSGWN